MAKKKKSEDTHLIAKYSVLMVFQMLLNSDGYFSRVVSLNTVIFNKCPDSSTERKVIKDQKEHRLRALYKTLLEFGFTDYDLYKACIGYDNGYACKYNRFTKAYEWYFNDFKYDAFKLEYQWDYWTVVEDDFGNTDEQDY